MLSWLILGALLLAFVLCSYYLVRIFLKRPLSYFAKVFILCADLVALAGIFLVFLLWLFHTQ